MTYELFETKLWKSLNVVLDVISKIQHLHIFPLNTTTCDHHLIYISDLNSSHNALLIFRLLDTLKTSGLIVDFLAGCYILSNMMLTKQACLNYHNNYIRVLIHYSGVNRVSYALRKGVALPSVLNIYTRAQ